MAEGGTMTELLQKAMDAVSGLPPEEQDAIASLVLEELAWEKTLSSDSSQAKLEEMADEAHREFLAGKTEPLDY
jgi:hypothetical protein